jgi:hypothetical protein
MRHIFGFVAIIALLCCCSSNLLRAQNLSQVIRGTVTDADSRKPIADAIIVLLPENLQISCESDSMGRFRLSECPVGRISLSVQAAGYEMKVLQNLVLNSGKELVLDLTLREQFRSLKDVVIANKRNKAAVANDMALVSARTFSVEETRRYAGSLNDPARMVSAFAGVNIDGAGNNDIIVRGNNPRNMQWRLEGVEIPNPNHFAAEGLTGGPINALNSQMLANSEFYTGAFNPQYGNALAGIFDMKLRNGNNEKREYAVSLGVLGTDLTAEGPFSKRYKGSYLINYRYSTLGLLDQAGIVQFNGVPKYQDGSFKIQLPTKSAGDFTVFGLGGKSIMAIKTRETDDDSNKLIEKWDQSGRVGIVGLKHLIRLSASTYLNSTFSVANNGSGGDGEKWLDASNWGNYVHLRFNNTGIRTNITLTHKQNSRNQFQLGLMQTHTAFQFQGNYYDAATSQYKTSQDKSGKADLWQGFALWKWRLSPQLSLVNGIHIQKTNLNKEWRVEPRSSLRWQLTGQQAISAGIGWHSKMESLTNYYSVIGGITPNSNLKFSKAFHAVAGYEHQLSKQLFLKAEVYFQHLYDIPIEDKAGSSYSVLNQDDLFSERVLINKGLGRNKGLELTLERYFDKRYYFLITASVFDAQYRAMDGVWRNSRYNSHFTSNVLAGKEFILSEKSNRKNILGLNTKLSYLGGRRLLAIDEAASQAAGKAVYEEQSAFVRQNDPVYFMNLGVQFRMERRRVTHELKLDVQNLSGRQAIVDYYYDNTKQKVTELKQLGTLPTLAYYLYF